MRYHITWGTYGSWLPGDPRGFRTRGHRQHVEGDHRHPPLPGQYEGLHAHARGLLKKPPVTLADGLWETVGRRCLEQFAKERFDVFAISVGGQHVHVAAVCSREGLKEAVGRAKKVSSHAVRATMPGRLWASGCRPAAIRDREHWQNVLGYILDHAPQAWVWCKPGVREGLGER